MNYGKQLKSSANEFYPGGSNKTTEGQGHLNNATAKEFYPNTSSVENNASKKVTDSPHHRLVPPCTQHLNVAASDFYPASVRRNNDETATTKVKQSDLTVTAAEFYPFQTQLSHLGHTVPAYSITTDTSRTTSPYHDDTSCYGQDDITSSYSTPFCISRTNDFWDFHEELERSTSMETRHLKIKERMSCKFFLQGACRNGVSCPFAHDAKNTSLTMNHKESQKKRDENNYSLYPGISCIFGPGAIVRDLILEGKDGKIGNNVVISGLCNGITDLIIEIKLSQFGKIESIVRKHETYAFVTFEDNTCVQAAIDALSGSSCSSWLKSKNHKCSRKKCSLTNIITLDSTVAPGSIMLQETTVKIQWYAPSIIAWANFHNKNHAKKAADNCNGKMLKGRKLGSKFQKPSHYQRDSFSAGLDPSCSKDQIKIFIQKHTKQSPFAVKLMKAPFNDSRGGQIVKKVLESYGQLTFFQEAPKTDALKRKALVKFQHAPDASKACTELSSTPRSELGGSKIFISRLFSGKVKIQTFIYQAIKSDIADITQTLYKINHVRHRVYEKSTYVTISFQADNPQGISKAKGMLMPILSGFCLMAKNSPLWHDYFMSIEAKNRLIQLNNQQIPGAYAHCDDRRCEIRLYGSANAREVLAHAIKLLLESAKQQKHAVPLTPEQFAFCARGGKILMDRISSYISSDSISLDLKTKSLLVESHTNEARKIVGIIRKGMEAIQNSPKGDGDKMCPICFCAAEEDNKGNIINLDCSHSYCHECFNSWIKGGQNCTFPLRCLHERCGKPIKLNELEAVLNEESFLSLLRSSVDHYVNRNIDNLHFCLSPECKGIYRINDQRVEKCPSCSMLICTNCNVEEHFGLTCAQHMMAKLPPNRLRNKVIEEILTLRCPRCCRAFLDFDGCFAIKCSNCPCNFCGWCLKDCGEDAHPHVKTCGQKPRIADTYFGTREQFEESQRTRQKKELQKFLESLTPRDRQNLLKSLSGDLKDLGLEL